MPSNDDRATDDTTDRFVSGSGGDDLEPITDPAERLPHVEPPSSADDAVDGFLTDDLGSIGGVRVRPDVDLAAADGLGLGGPLVAESPAGAAAAESCDEAETGAAHPQVIVGGNFNAMADQTGYVSGRFAIRVIGHFGGFRP